MALELKAAKANNLLPQAAKSGLILLII